MPHPNENDPHLLTPTEPEWAGGRAKALVRRSMPRSYARLRRALGLTRIDALETKVAVLAEALADYASALATATEEARLAAVEADWSARRAAKLLGRSLFGGPAGLDSLEDNELRVRSQNGEDGIVLRLFGVLGHGNRHAIEIGAGAGEESIAAHLVRDWGWNLVAFERDPERAAAASVAFNDGRGSAIVSNATVTAENIDELLRAAGSSPTVDLLAIDIDGNDYWVWKAMSAVSPRVVVIEYNAAFGPEVAAVVPYDPEWRYDDLAGSTDMTRIVYFGASLTALTRLAVEKGYALVGGDSRGVNAFFVRRDALTPALKPVDPLSAWRPCSHRLSIVDQQTQFNLVTSQPLVWL